MSPKTLRRLLRTAHKLKSYEQFERHVLSSLHWYKLPCHWTKTQLKDFYFMNGGN